MAKLWNGKKLNKEIENFTVGNDYILDQRLVRYDCLASIAHARMLGKIGILNPKEVKKLVKGLNEIINLNKAGRFKIKKEDEDCHTAIENYLTRKLGDLGKKVHTGRSRNDQALVALRLYFKNELKEVKNLVKDLVKAIKRFSRKYGRIEIPGYTHSRKATPSTIANWAGAFQESMEDNLKLLEAVFELIDQSPLGSVVGYTSPLKLDRKYTAKLLGFSKVQNNPLYAQNSRGKFESLVIHLLSMIMFDLNKVSSDLILFTMSEFGYFELSFDFCTGSSIMPQKKNPDVLEILKGNYYLVLGFEFQVKGLIGNLISGYSREFQLTKEPVMRSFDITKSSLSVMRLVLENLKVNAKRCQEGLTKEVYATEEVYRFVKRGVPFRDAYKRVSKQYE